MRRRTELPSLFSDLSLDADRGADQRNAGIDQAINHADQVTQSWRLRAYFQLTSFLTTIQDRFMTEDVRKYAEGNGLPIPPSNRAWGAVVCLAKKDNLIRQVGYGKVKNTKAHRANAAIWVKV